MPVLGLVGAEMWLFAHRAQNGTGEPEAALPLPEQCPWP